MYTKIAQITDLHLLTSGEPLMGLGVLDRFKQVLEHSRSFEPDAYFLTGDFCAHDPVQEVYHQLRSLLDNLTKPYYLTPGNHDNRAMMRNAFFLEGHEQQPIKGVVKVKDRYFIFLDSSAGTVDKEQLGWLTKALGQYPQSDIVIHHPPMKMGVSFMDEKYPLKDTDKLLGILRSDGRHRRIFCGHYHTGRMMTHQNLSIHLCPPTSFFINPNADSFEQEFLPPAYLRLSWDEEGNFRSIPTYVI